MRQDRLVVYHKAPWPHALIFNAFPRARRVAAGFDDTPEKVMGQLPSGTKCFLYHIDLTNSEAFPRDRAALTQMLRARGIEVLNTDLTDTSKSFLHEACVRAGINCSKASRDGDGDELLMIKTAANCAGASEKKLTLAQRRRLELAEPHEEITHTKFYKVLPRRAIPEAWWNDPRLVVDRYINNRANRMWRFCLLLDHVFVSEYAAHGFCKKLDVVDYRLNSWGRWSAAGIRLGKGTCIPPPQLVTQFVGVVQELNMMYGTIDTVEDDAGRHFVIDVNSTPAGARTSQPGMLEHLRSALGITVEPRRRIVDWLAY